MPPKLAAHGEPVPPGRFPDVPFANIDELTMIEHFGPLPAFVWPAKTFAEGIVKAAFINPANVWAYNGSCPVFD